MLGARDRGHRGAKMLQQLDRRRTDRPGGPIDQNVLAAGDLGLPDEGQGIVGPLGTGRGLLEAQLRRDGGQEPVLGDGQVLGMGAERQPFEAEYPLADPGRGDAPASCLHGSGELGPQDRHPWPGQPGEGPNEEGLARPEPAVGAVHRGRMHLYQDLVVLGGRLVDLGDPDDVRRTVAGVDRCPSWAYPSADVTDLEGWLERHASRKPRNKPAAQGRMPSCWPVGPPGP
jgi:hypothetical protein